MLIWNEADGEDRLWRQLLSGGLIKSHMLQLDCGGLVPVYIQALRRIWCVVRGESSRDAMSKGVDSREKERSSID